MSGTDNRHTAHAYAVIRMPPVASFTPKSAEMSTSRPMGMNSDVLNMNAVAATEIIAAHSRAVIFPACDATPLRPFFSMQDR